jgi:adenosylhomocysteine nucleosidase
MEVPMSSPRHLWYNALRLILLSGLALLIGCSKRPLSPGQRMTTRHALYAVMAPTEQELASLETAARSQYRGGSVEIHNGIPYRHATLAGRACILVPCGMSVVNAAMITQAALDRYPITHVIVLGEAGGVNPSRGPGDVIVPEAWSHHTEAAVVNPKADGGWEVTRSASGVPNFGMIFPETVTVTRSGSRGTEPMPRFPVDPGLRMAATKAASPLSPTNSTSSPRFLTSGMGVSGPLFVANRDYRAWLFNAWRAEVVDLESAAIAQVCWANRVPFIAVRSISGLAGEPPPKVAPNPPPIQRAAQLVISMLEELPR